MFVDTPALVALHASAVLLTGEGEFLHLPHAGMRALLPQHKPPLVVHAPATARRLGLAGFPALDLLELFAFVRPATNAAPTPRGLALALGLAVPANPEGEAATLGALADALLAGLGRIRGTPGAAEAAALATVLAGAGWSWARSVLAALHGVAPLAGDPLAVWRRLPAWEDTAPPPPPASRPVPPDASRHRLASLLGQNAEARPGQSDYAHAAAAAFAPRERRGDPVLLLAEAGTGTGKTLGYLAPASLWAERNGGTVWISTYTRHLQRQIENETERLHPGAAARRRRVVVRKGRENYLCLLNYEDAVRGARGRGPAGHAAALPLALVARWATATADGDLASGDLPGWFRDLFGPATVNNLADRRGECIHGACPHYTTCYVEHSIRRARTADLVIANHALVMAQAAHAGSGAGSEDRMPTRYVFDEGHHLADAADGAFAVELSGAEAAELRRWLLGAEGARSRARGLRRRLDDLIAGEAALETPLDAALLAAGQALPSPGWTRRRHTGIGGEASAGRAVPSEEAGATPNPAERFLALLRAQVLARDGGGTECDLHPTAPGLADAASVLARALERVRAPLDRLTERLAARLDAEADTLDTATRNRIEAMVGVIRRRALARLTAWIDMLAAVGAIPDDGAVGARCEHVHFARLAGRDAAAPDGDVALCRHWLDPTLPFALTLAAGAHGVLVTSATLRDQTGTATADVNDPGDGGGAAEAAWAAAERRVGAPHLPSPALRAALPSPFDYRAQTRCFVVTDVAGGDLDALAGAFRALFTASGGGGLGLFTAISRLRAVHARIAAPLEAAGIPLFAQHVDAMDNASLVACFRAERDSCLLGTDAMRDGVDVPGAALRLVVFERVPWPRPDILHRERRLHLSGGAPSAYDDGLVRLRLRQAFGRLIRSRVDRGAFVLLDRRMPSRLAGAFPPGAEPVRTGLADAATAIRRFLGDT